MAHRPGWGIIFTGLFSFLSGAGINRCIPGAQDWREGGRVAGQQKHSISGEKKNKIRHLTRTIAGSGGGADWEGW